jgi:predicted alpha-1,2-mannosidase
MHLQWRGLGFRGLIVLAAIVLTAGLAYGLSSGPASAATIANPASLVNPFLGTSNGGDTFPGADAPFGMVAWSPDTTSRPPGGFYSYGDDNLTGFSLNHLSGPGCGAEGDVPILPTTGNVNPSAYEGFSHSNESASPGAYQVGLSDGVNVQLTVTSRTGMGRFTFPSTTQANLQIGVGATGSSTFNVVSSTEVTGSVTTGHFCASSPTYTLYFDMVFDQPMTGHSSYTNGDAVTFNTTSNNVVQAKVGVSYVSIANATGNLNAENPGWNFGATQTATQNAWNSQLSKIAVAGGTSNQQVVFYTALYHALLHPNIFSDDNGQYPGFDYKTHTVSGAQQVQYANFSGWDIYRTQAQLEAMIDPQQASDAAQSLLNDYDQIGYLPKWPLNQADTFVQNGDSAEPIIADYYAFGAHNFDTTGAENAMVHQATVANPIRSGLNYQTSLGYLPSDGTYPSGFYGDVATLLEYDTDDFSIGAFAGALGDTTTQQEFTNRAQDWKNVLNPSGFMAPKLSNGQWTSGFDPTTSNDMVEGTSWQYTGMVPFNVGGLAAAKGGNSAMDSYLNTVLGGFHGGTNNTNHSEMGNEPSIELPWEYDYIGEPYKTQQVIREVEDQLWTNSDSNWALDGNDDLGTMSAWYVWSALGMYPMTPGTADMALGSPLFTSATVSLGGGGQLNISAPNAADNAPYVQSATLNGNAWNNAYLDPSVMTGGGNLVFNLGTSPNTSWASGASSAPPSYAGNGGAQPPAGGPVKSGIAGKCMDVNGGNSADGTAVQLYDCNNTAAQNWTATSAGQLESVGKCLDATALGTANGTKLELWDCNGGSNQVWNAYNGGYRNPVSGRCIDDPGGSTTNGTQLELWDCNGGTNQQWSAPGGTRVGPITSAISGKCIDDNAASTADGTKIQSYTCNGSAAQQITIPGDGSLQVEGKCLDVTGGGTANGTLIQLYDCNGTGAQQWTYNSSNGQLVNPQSGRCLDIPGGSTTDGTQLEIWDCNGGANQDWTEPA